MRSRVIIHLSVKDRAQIFGQIFNDVNDKLIFLFRINNENFFVCTFNITRVANLSTTFCIEWGAIKNQLNQLFILLFDLPIFGNLYFSIQMIIANELRPMILPD